MRLYEFDKPTYTRSRSVQVDNYDLAKIKNECSEILSKSATIYRGIETKGSDVLFFDGKSKTPRKSANTYNFTTLLMDNLPSWSKFPKRSESLICSTTSFQASGYGFTYRVLPVNGAKIGVCDRFDMWMSFQELTKYGLRVNHFNEQLYDLYEFVMDDVLDDTNFNKFRNQINNLSEKLPTIDLDSLPYSVEELKMVFLPKNIGNDLFTVMTEIFNPKTNDFKLRKTSNFNVDGNQEVWTNGPAYLIENKFFEQNFGAQDAIV